MQGNYFSSQEMLKNKRVSKSCAEGSSEAYLLWWAMADSIENAGRATVSGSKETMEVSKNFKDLRECGVGNTAQYSVANVPLNDFLQLFHRHSFLPYSVEVKSSIASFLV